MKTNMLVVLLLIAAMPGLGSIGKNQRMAAIRKLDISSGTRMEIAAPRDPVCLPGDPCGPGGSRP